MKYARLTVNAPPEAGSAVHRAAMGVPELGDAYLLFGGIKEREPTQFYAVEGARAPLVDALEAADAVSYYDVASVDDDYVYVYTQEVATEANRRLRATFTRDSLVTTLPVVYRADGTASFTVVGRPRTCRPPSRTPARSRTSRSTASATTTRARPTTRRRSRTASARSWRWPSTPATTTSRGPRARTTSRRNWTARPRPSPNTSGRRRRRWRARRFATTRDSEGVTVDETAEATANDTAGILAD
nr:hypothetical protein [Halobacterium bonnevillei]